MPVTILDPTTALTVVDLQAGLTDLPTVHPLGDIVANTAALADAFRAKGLHRTGSNPSAVPERWSIRSLEHSLDAEGDWRRRRATGQTSRAVPRPAAPH